MASSGVLLILLLICVLMVALGIAAAGGAVAGQRERDIQATQTTVVEIDLQFGLAMADQEAGRYELAAQRLRWILERAPHYPGAAERLAQVEQLMGLGGTVAPTLAPSTHQDPEAIFQEAQEYYDREEWANAITRLEEVQGIDPTYHEIEAKEMLYHSLVTLGLSYVRGDRIEEGLFLLDRAEAIRPLDDQTAGERYLATLYSTGLVYSYLDWQIAINNFQAAYDLAPNYRDTADRLWDAYVKYGDQLLLGGGGCEAVTQYEAALALRDDEEVRQKVQDAQGACSNPTALPTATLVSAGTPGPTRTPSATNTPGGINPIP
jgi:tetratricopeptide (TPR) repeat protein